ncbi:MAG TPA: protein kinase [Pyrinomonadaceae bacterium]
MIGQTISHYRIKEKIGEGGMGVVYLAEDTHLARDVAIKFLALANDSHYRSRFLREARAISTLSHPNIAIIHDYGETNDGQPFIVMEYIKGQTLSELLLQSALTITRAVEIIEAVTEALGAAHKRGIIHRDVKPSNVVVNELGQVKVLDFGLAKQMFESAAHDVSPNANTLLGARTGSNVVVGTPMYLSPEQATGGNVDARSDLFALGTLLYECLTGKPAFAGGSLIEIGAQIIHFNPLPPSAINKRVTPELDRITLKALEKKPDQRYQSAGEMAGDLHAARLGLNDQSGHRTQRIHVSSGHSSALRTLSDSLAQPRLSIGFFAIVMVCVALAGWAIWRRAQRRAPVPFENLTVRQLTNAGNTADAVISPDGKYVAHVVDDGNQQSLWVRQVSTSSDIEIQPPSTTKYEGLTFSKDSDYIFYNQRQTVAGSSDLYMIPVLGGSPRRVVSDLISPVTLSPDGRRIAFIRRFPAGGETAVIVANVDGSGEQRLATRTPPEYFYVAGPSWSRNGSLVCAGGNSERGFHMNLVEIRVQDGMTKAITPENWFVIERLVWSPDGAGITITAATEPGSPFQLWYVSYPGGQSRRITNDLSSYVGLSQSEDAKTLVTVKTERVLNVWVTPSVDASRARMVAPGSAESGLTWSTTNWIVFTSNVSGSTDVWLINADGTNKKQMTFDIFTERDPSISPDGRYLVFTSNRAGAFNVWRMDIDGNNPKQLTTGGDEQFPSFSPDGQWVIYQGFVGGVPTVWKVPIEGGQSIQLTNKYSNSPTVSPDGKQLAYLYLDSGSRWKVVIMPLDGGPTKSFDIPRLSIPNLSWQRVRWTRDGQALTYIDNRDNVSNIWKQSIAGGPPQQVTDFKSDRIINFDWSPDGRSLACVRGVVKSDVVQLTDAGK